MKGSTQAPQEFYEGDELRVQGRGFRVQGGVKFRILLQGFRESRGLELGVGAASIGLCSFSS